MLLNYKKFTGKDILVENIIEEIGDKDVNNLIDSAYKYFKDIQKPVNTLDIINYVEEIYGKELDDDDYEELYYKITAEDFNGDEIEDLEEEEKYIIK